MAYNTGNALGSIDARDLYDNAINLDNAVNGSAARWTDRLGVSRTSWAGMSHYNDIGAYAGGLLITGYNEIFLHDGEYYRPAAATVLPYTTTGSWLDDGVDFVPIGDANLRSELSSGTTGAINGMINVAYFGTLEEARTNSEAEGRTIVVDNVLTEAQSNITGEWPDDRALKVEKGGSIGNTTTFNFESNSSFIAGNYQVFAGSGSVTGLKESRPEWFGAPYGSTNDADDAGPAIRKAVAALSSGGVLKLTGTYTIQTDDGTGGFSVPNNVTIKGLGRRVTGFYAGNSFPAKPLGYSISPTTKRITMKDMFLQNFGDASFSPGTSLATHAFYGENVADSNFEDVDIRYFFNGAGVKLDAPNIVTAYYNLFKNVGITGKYGYHFTGNAVVNQANSNTIIGGSIIGIAASGSVNGILLDGGLGSTTVIETDIAGGFTGPAIVMDNSSNNTLAPRMELSQITGANLYFEEKNGSKDNRINANLPRPLRSSYLAPGSTWPGLTDTVQNIVLTGAQATYTVPEFQALTIVIDCRSLTADLRIALPNARNITQGQKITIIRSGITDDSAFSVIIQSNPNSLIDGVNNSNTETMSLGWKNTATFTCNTVSSTVAKWLVEKASDTATASPTKGVYRRGDVVLNRTPSASGVPGWVCVNSTIGTILSNASAGATQIGMVTTSVLAGDIVNLFHADGTQGYYVIQTVDSGTLATLTTPLTANVATGFQNLMHTIFTYRFKTMAALGA